MDTSQSLNQPIRPAQTAELALEPADATRTTSETADTWQIPVIAEVISVGKRVVETGHVRLVKTIHEDQQDVAIPLLAEQIDIERVPIDRLVDEAPATRQEGATTIYPVLQEEYVVVKRWRVVEEIRVTKRQVQTTEQQTVSLRREEVVVERSAVKITHGRSDLPGVDSPRESSL